MLSNTYTVTQLHTSTTTEGVDALIEQLEQDKINAKNNRLKYLDAMSNYHRNSKIFKHHMQWYLVEIERGNNAKKYLNILRKKFVINVLFETFFSLKT